VDSLDIHCYKSRRGGLDEDPIPTKFQELLFTGSELEHLITFVTLSFTASLPDGVLFQLAIFQNPKASFHPQPSM
jgi:hypothetical protein